MTTVIQWRPFKKHRSFEDGVKRGLCGSVVVVLIEERKFHDKVERYDVTFTLPIGRPEDWAETGRHNNITGRDFKTLQGAEQFAERRVADWLKRAKLRPR